MSKISGTIIFCLQIYIICHLAFSCNVIQFYGIIQFISLSIFYSVGKGYRFFTEIEYILREHHSVNYLASLDFDDVKYY